MYVAASDGPRCNGLNLEAEAVSAAQHRAPALVGLFARPQAAAVVAHGGREKVRRHADAIRCCPLEHSSQADGEHCGIEEGLRRM